MSAGKRTEREQALLTELIYALGIDSDIIPGRPNAEDVALGLLNVLAAELFVLKCATESDSVDLDDVNKVAWKMCERLDAGIRLVERLRAGEYGDEDEGDGGDEDDAGEAVTAAAVAVAPAN